MTRIYDLVNPTEYFRGCIHQASSSLKIVLREEVEFYLVRLLVNFINPQKLNETFGENGDVLDMSLVSMLQRAMDTQSVEQRYYMLRSLGDTTLYISGYFQDYFNRKTFDIGYYMELGSMAYSNASQLGAGKLEQVDVLGDLSQNFNQFVDIVAEVASSFQLNDNKDVLVIYDRWLRSNSVRLRKILNDLGIEPVNNIPFKIAQ